MGVGLCPLPRALISFLISFFECFFLLFYRQLAPFRRKWRFHPNYDGYLEWLKNSMEYVLKYFYSLVG